MHHYTTQKPITLSTGLIGVTKDLANRHAHNLKATDKPDTYRILRPVQLKAGVKFSYSEEIPKALCNIVEPVKTEPEPAPNSEPVKEQSRPESREQSKQHGIPRRR